MRLPWRWCGNPASVAMVIALGGAVVACDGNPLGNTSAPASLEKVTLPALEELGARSRARVSAAYERATQSSESLGTPAERANAWGDLGMLLYAVERRGTAATALTNATRLAPDEVRWRYYLGATWLAEGRATEATRELDHAAQLRPQDLSIRLLLARAYREEGRNDQAEALLQSIVSEQPDHAVAHRRLGDLAAD